MGETLGSIMRHPSLLFLTFGHRGLFNWMDDATYLKIAFRIRMGEKLDLHHPVTFNQKLQWLKLNDRKPEYSNLVDKYEVKRIVAEKIGNEYVIPTLGVWDKFEDIDFDSLPNQFVLKCTHNSGGLIIVRDKSKLDIEEARKKINKSLKHNYYWGQREWVYKNVKPRIIAEKYMEEKRNEGRYVIGQDIQLVDYKFLCFNGKVQSIFTCTERNSNDGLKVTFFDREWNKMTFERHYPSSRKTVNRPYNLEKMIKLSERLAGDIPFVRIDLYNINDRIYFGEYTFFPGSGMEEFTPREWDVRLGDMIELS